MLICSDCTSTKPIARCVTNLIIGRISSLDTPVYVYIKNITLDDREIRYATTSSGTGVVVIPITPQRFSEDHTYEIHITKQDADNINVKENIIIGGEVNDCVSLQFETVWQNDNTIATYEYQTLTV